LGKQTREWEKVPEMSKLKMISFAAVALAASVLGAQAAPVSPIYAQPAASVDTTGVTQVYYRRWGGWGYRGWRRPGIGLGIGAGLIAGAIIADRAYAPRRGYYYDTYAYDGPYYYPESYSGDPRRICAQNFRSFEWRTGMYTTYGGERRLCPYLS
jgi:BA14K-like protein